MMQADIIEEIKRRATANAASARNNPDASGHIRVPE
jgi:hypothetical protein